MYIQQALIHTHTHTLSLSFSLSLNMEKMFLPISPSVQAKVEEEKNVRVSMFFFRLGIRGRLSEVLNN